MEQLYVPVVHGAALDRPDEADTVMTARAIAASLRRLGYETVIICVTQDLEGLEPLTRRRPALVFNLVEALGGEAVEAVRAMEHLETLGLSYTGVPADAYRIANSKLETKLRLACHAIPAPQCWTAADAIPPDATVIIKSVEEHGSLGLDQCSIVKGALARTEIACREAEFGGQFFAEVYVDGREFNVSVLETDTGPLVLPIAEIDFAALPPGRAAIVDFAAKWNSEDIAYHATPRRFGLDRNEAALAEEIRRLTLACWHGFGLNGYARIDFRVDDLGRPFVIEVNANPCLAPDAGFAAAAAKAGFSYDELIAAIVNTAKQPSRQVA